MNITLTGTKVKIDNRTLAFEGNSGVDEIVVIVDTDESWTYKLDVDYADDNCCCGDDHYNIIQLTREGNTCSATLSMDMLPYSGRYIMQLRAINEDGRVYHSEMFEAWVKKSINPWKIYTPVPSEFLQIEENITEANQHPPYPDPNGSGYWMIWNIEKRQYELSDIPITGGSGDKTLKKYSANNTALTATGGVFTWTINATTHGISQPLVVQLFEVAGGAQVIADVIVTSTAITIQISDSANANTLTANTYKVVIIG